tara:strand:- start:461 stop:859 length:399 start_codon:yes stop_codon:yes gene_type:complete
MPPPISARVSPEKGGVRLRLTVSVALTVQFEEHTLLHLRVLPHVLMERVFRTACKRMRLSEFDLSVYGARGRVRMDIEAGALVGSLPHRLVIRQKKRLFQEAFGRSAARDVLHNFTLAPKTCRPNFGEWYCS